MYRLMFFLLLSVMLSNKLLAQKYEFFEIRNNELVWQYTYEFPGTQDSIRREVVSMLKSKIFTQQVVRNELGYNGELRHYKVDCERYHRKYNNTPLIYWSGEWSGKFVIEITDNHYRVTIYGLYFENKPQQVSRFQTNPGRKGYYTEEVWKKGSPHFKKNKFEDMTFMSISLRDAFDIKQYSSPVID
jgi:hypothetical protein